MGAKRLDDITWSCAVTGEIHLSYPCDFCGICREFEEREFEEFDEAEDD